MSLTDYWVPKTVPCLYSAHNIAHPNSKYLRVSHINRPLQSLVVHSPMYHKMFVAWRKASKSTNQNPIISEHLDKVEYFRVLCRDE
jgi:hypothetical protein